MPQVNADGDELAGARIPEVAMPLATAADWNVRDAASSFPDHLTSFVLLCSVSVDERRANSRRSAAGDRGTLCGRM